ncbi:unnamed protein product, partial [Symbiodinium necroappetens]
MWRALPCRLPGRRSTCSEAASAAQALLQAGAALHFAGPDGWVRATAGRHLGSGTFASVWELQLSPPQSFGDLAVLKHFPKVSAAVAAFFGQSLLGQHRKQWEKEKAVGDRLSSGPQHKGRGHVVALLSSQPIFLAEARDLRQDAEANSELMLVLEHAGQPLESIRMESLDLPSRCDIINQLLHAVKLLRLNGIIHADISAGNCCLDADGRARLVDFGNSLLVSTAQRAAACQPLERFRARYVHHRRFPCCARYSYPLSIRRLVEEIERPNTIDVYGCCYDVEAFPGNLAATPPEVLRGLMVPGASDVYGLGILLWWLLTGQSFDCDVACMRGGYYVDGFSEPMQFVPENLRLERSLHRAQEVMSQALANFEREEAGKFNKIYAFLEELSTRQLKLEQAVANLESDIREQAQKVVHTPDASSTMQMVMYDPSTNVMTPVMAPYADSQMSMMPMVCMVQSMPEGQFGVQETSFQQLHYQESATQETAPQESAPVEHTGPQETTSQETAVKEAPLEETPFLVDVEVDRVSFPGWAHFYRSAANVQLEELRSKLAEATPEMPQLWQTDVARWLQSALAEAPEDRAWASNNPVLLLSGIHSQQLVCFPIPAAMAKLSETLRIYAEVLPPQLQRDVWFGPAKSTGALLQQMELHPGSIYGEITAEGAAQVAARLGLQDFGEREAAAELGSGAGRCALALLQESQAASIVGVELASARHDAALLLAGSCLKEWTRLDTKEGATWFRDGRSFCLIRGDILQTWRDWCHVTAVFTSSLCFPAVVMDTLSRQLDECKLLQRVATLQMLPHALTFGLTDVLRCPMSWKPNGSAVYVYERLPSYPLYRSLLEEPLAALFRAEEPPGRLGTATEKLRAGKLAQLLLSSLLPLCGSLEKSSQSMVWDQVGSPAITELCAAHGLEGLEQEHQLATPGATAAVELQRWSNMTSHALCRCICGSSRLNEQLERAGEVVAHGPRKPEPAPETNVISYNYPIQGRLSYSLLADQPLRGAPIREGDLWHLSTEERVDPVHVSLHINGFRFYLDGAEMAISLSPFTLVRNCKFQSTYPMLNVADFKIFKVSLFAQGACYYFGVRGENEREAEELRSRWVLDISRAMRLVTQTLFPPFQISCRPLDAVPSTHSRLMAGYLVHFDDCFTASVLYCELHVQTQQDHTKIILYENESCRQKLAEIYVTDRSICCEKIGINCSCFSVEDHQFSARSLGERKLWLRAISNLKVKLQNSAPVPSQTETCQYREAVQEHAKQHTVHEGHAKTDALLQRTFIRPLGSPSEACHGTLGALPVPPVPPLAEDFDRPGQADAEQGGNGGVLGPAAIPSPSAHTETHPLRRSSSLSEPLRKLSHVWLRLEPRYLVCGSMDIFYQRPPFQTPKAGHVCRCIALGKVSSKGKARTAFHGLSLSPAATMPETALKQRPANTTPSPFVVASEEQGEEESRGVKRDAATMEDDGPPPEPDTVFLGRLPANIEEKRIEAALKHVGKIERIHLVREAGEGSACKGFGFVTFSTPEEAEAACDLSELLECGGRKITISISRPTKKSDGPRKKREIQI